MREQRMCSITLRHLTGIQKGIQTSHAIVEYGLKFGDTLEYKRWAKKDKTLIVLEAHSTQQLEEAYNEFKKAGVAVAKFIEPDINNAITAICFLMDETVWNTQKYGDTLDPEVLFIRRIKNKFLLATN